MAIHRSELPHPSAPVWSALADRFAALAAEQEFDLHLYSVANHHYPSGVTDAEIRFWSPAHLIRERTRFTGIALTGSPKLTPDEFIRFNRFRWLAWSAGRALNATAPRPELEWLFTVHSANPSLCESLESQNHLRRVATASATTARLFAERGCPDASNKTDMATALQPGSWQQPLLTLREAFWHHANERFDFHLELHGYTTPNPFGVGGEQLRQLQKHYALMGRGINTRTSPQLMCWTASDPGGIYTELAQHAGRQLPEQFVPSLRLLPPGVNAIGQDQRPDPLVAWAEFLWLANPLNYKRCIEPDDPGARKAVWEGGNPFMASALAIDQFVKNYGPDTIAQLTKRIVEVCPWFQREDQIAAFAAVQAAARSETAPRTGVTLHSVHWTDFPEIVERFGDLLSILETLDRHRDFNFECFPEHAEQAAYTVDLDAATYHFEPRCDRMPGLERILTHFDQGHIPELTLRALREAHGRVARVLKIDRPAVNAMRFVEIADALDAAALRVPPVAPPAEATRQECQVHTLRELLADVQSVEQAAASTRAEADAMNGDPGSGAWRIQAAIFEADAEYKKHPAFPVLEAYTNAHYGPATYENLIQVRGSVCQACRCGTDEANRMLLEEVIRILGSVGATPPPVPHKPTPAPVTAAQPTGPYTLNDIRDLLHYRRAHAGYLAGLRSINPGAVVAASFGKLLGIPPIHHVNTLLALIAPEPPRMSEDEALVQPVYHWLVREARADKEELDEDTLRLIVGRVAIVTKRPFPDLMGLPLQEFDRVRSSIPSGGDPVLVHTEPILTPPPNTPTTQKIDPRPTAAAQVQPDQPARQTWPALVIDLSDTGYDETTPPPMAVVEGGPKVVVQAGPIPRELKPAGTIPRDLKYAGTTPPDPERERIRDLVARSIPAPTQQSPPEPPPDQIEAAALRLCDAMAGDVYGWPDKDGGRLIELDVANNGPGIEPSPFNRPRSAAAFHAACWLVRTDLVTVVAIPRQRRGEARGSSASQGTSVAIRSEQERPLMCLKATPELWTRHKAGRIFDEVAASGASGQKGRREGGRPKLGEGLTATAEQKALRNLYELIRAAMQDGWGPKKLLKHFRDNKDFKARIKDTGQTWGEQLFKNALAWIGDNPDQKTQSGNVS